MQFFRKLTLAFGILTAATAQAHAGKVTRTVPVDDHFALHELTWKPRGKTVIRWAVIDDDGYLAVCGGYSANGGSIAFKASGDLLATAAIRMDDETILRNLRYFAQFKSNMQSEEHVGEEANCVRTKTPSPKSDVSFEMYSTKTKFVY